MAPVVFPSVNSVHRPAFRWFGVPALQVPDPAPPYRVPDSWFQECLVLVRAMRSARAVSAVEEVSPGAPVEWFNSEREVFRGSPWMSPRVLG